jgi:hypothetical protein
MHWTEDAGPDLTGTVTPSCVQEECGRETSAGQVVAVCYSQIAVAFVKSCCASRPSRPVRWANQPGINCLDVTLVHPLAVAVRRLVWSRVRSVPSGLRDKCVHEVRRHPGRRDSE